MTCTTQVSGGAEYKDVVIPYDRKPLASYLSWSKSTMYRKKTMEEELKQKLQQSGAELRTMPQNRSILHSPQRTI